MPDDFPTKRLSEVHLRTIGFDCHGCYRQTAVEWRDLERRFAGDPTLGEIALQLAKGSRGNPCRQPDDCQARAFEMPVETWATLDIAYRGNWRLELECGRRHEGLKAAKSCVGLFEISVRTLYSAFGYDYPLDRLRLRCPRCLSRHVNLIWTVPPPPPAPKDEIKRMPDGRPVGLDQEALAFNAKLAMGK